MCNIIVGAWQYLTPRHLIVQAISCWWYRLGFDLWAHDFAADDAKFGLSWCAGLRRTFVRRGAVVEGILFLVEASLWHPLVHAHRLIRGNRLGQRLLLWHHESVVRRRGYSASISWHNSLTDGSESVLRRETIISSSSIIDTAVVWLLLWRFSDRVSRLTGAALNGSGAVGPGWVEHLRLRCRLVRCRCLTVHGALGHALRRWSWHD